MEIDGVGIISVEYPSAYEKKINIIDYNQII